MDLALACQILPPPLRTVAFYRRGNARLRLRANGSLARLDPPARLWRVVGLRYDRLAADRYAMRYGFEVVVARSPADRPIRVPSASVGRRRSDRCLPKPDGTSERVERYRRRVEDGFGVFEPPTNDEGQPRCWCCGRIAPRTRWLSRIGWLARWGHLYGGHEARETYCPECYAEYGWPDQARTEAGCA